MMNFPFKAVLKWLFLLAPVFILAQPKGLDSLNKVLVKTPTGVARIELLLTISAEQARAGNFKDALRRGHEALALSIKLKDKKNTALSATNLGMVHNYTGTLDSVIIYYTKASELHEQTGEKNLLAETLINIGMAYLDSGDATKAFEFCNRGKSLYVDTRDQKGLADALVYISNIYYSQSDFPKTLDYLVRASKLYDSLDNKESLCACYTNMGIIHATQKDYPKALDYFRQGLTINRKARNQFAIAYSLANVGGVYASLAQFDSALYYHRQALVIEDELNDRPGKATTLGGISGIFLDMGNADSALVYGIRSEALFKETGNKPNLASTYNTIARCYLKKGELVPALKYAEFDLETATEINSLDEIKGAEKLLSDIYSALGKTAPAFEHYKKYIALRDSLYNGENTKLIVQKDMNYQFEKQQEKIRAEQEKKDFENEQAKKQQRIIIFSVVAGLLMVIIFLVFLYKRFKITQKQKHIIEKQHRLLEERNKEVFDSITYAKRLQDAILPPVKLIESVFPQSFVLYKPKDIVAGDFYWMETIVTQNLTLFAAADSTGHGVPGAMVSVVCSNALNRAVKEFNLHEPAKILDKVRELVLDTFAKSESDVKDGMDISLASIQHSTNGKVVIHWAGANNPLWYISEGLLKTITANKQPIGKTDNPVPFTNHTLELKAQDCIYLLTDGYADQFGGPKGKKFKYKQLQQIVQDNCIKPMSEQKEILNSSIENWKGTLEQVDDVTIIGIKF